MTRTAIRTATPDDVPAILGLIRELARFEEAEDQVKATEDDLLRDGWGVSPKFEAMVAEMDGAVEGFTLFFHNYSTWEGRAGIHIEDLYVSEKTRGTGLGRKLVSAVAALAVERGCRRLDLSVLDWNPARGFYDALGFAHMDEWLHYRATGDDLNRLAAEGKGSVT
ncbi:GNAT family N-acetyltransferase [Inquilinus sp. CAU 1745]|uniref:GNAT family N-acetyltransferase n=1 Tax=Inquilinus sp. CAU 1745 TaxID=3140369 RepID=UPI00325BBB85